MLLRCDLPRPSHDELAALASLVNDFSRQGLFSVQSLDLGMLRHDRAEDFPFRIRLDGPVDHNVAPYKNSHAGWEWFSTVLPDLLLYDVIEHAFDAEGNPSPYASSPLIIGKKQPGEFRFTVDYRKINFETIRDGFPAPDTTRCLESLGQSCWFTALDLTSGYWQIPIAMDSRQYTAFRTRDAHMQFKRLSMGLRNACAHFQRIMGFILMPQCKDFVVIYLDDIIIHTNGTFHDHLAKLHIVFQLLLDAGLKLKSSKCQFGARSLAYLGHIVGPDGIRMDPDKISPIRDMPFPRAPIQVKSFLGMVGYYAHFIPKYATVAAPLYAATHATYTWVVTPSMVKAFDDLKAMLTRDPVLRLPDFNQPFVVTTDWSKLAISGVLGQLDPHQFEYAVRYASRICSGAESRYCPTHGECLAIIWAAEKFHYYLHGHRWHLKTDHRALQWLNTAKFTSTKLARWALQLQEFDFTVAHCRGELNVVSDYLTRGAVPKSTSHVAAVSAFTDAVFDNPAQYHKAYACAVCNRVDGADNMVICDSCSTLYHLRCMVPPMTMIPSGPWICPTCAPPVDTWSSCYYADTPLAYADNDPYRDVALLEYVLTRDMSLIESIMEVPLSKNQKRSIRRRAETLRPSSVQIDWLDMRVPSGSDVVWLTCPTVHYRWDIIRLFHDQLGHPGITRTVAAVMRQYYWQGINRDVRAFISTCDACQRFALRCPDIPKNMESMQYSEVLGAYRHVHLDSFGPFPHPTIVSNGVPALVHVLVMVCAFTKCVEFGLYVNCYTNQCEHSAHVTSRLFFEHWLSRYIVPDVVTTDNGPEFGSVFQRLLADYGIEGRQTSVRNPAANGNAEAVVKYAKRALSRLCANDPTSAVLQLPKVRGAFMRQVSTATGLTPFALTYGLQPDVPVPLGPTLHALYARGVPPMPTNTEYHARVDDLAVKLHAADRRAFANILRAQYRNMVAFENSLKREPANAPVPGDFVLLLAPAPSTLHATWDGPFLFHSVDPPSGLAVLQSGSDPMLDVAGRGNALWKVKRHLIRLYLFPFQLTRPPAADAPLVAALSH